LASLLVHMITALPVVENSPLAALRATSDISPPYDVRLSSNAVPCKSSPTAPAIITARLASCNSVRVLGSFAQTTAWLAPLPPGNTSKWLAVRVLPGYRVADGEEGRWYTRSVFNEPSTQMIGVDRAKLKLSVCLGRGRGVDVVHAERGIEACGVYTDICVM
jgi:hypothetical protein